MPIDRGGYGKDLYSSGDYGTEGITSSAGAVISATSSCSAEGGISKSSGALFVVTSTITCAGNRDRTSSANISVAAVFTASGEDIIREDSDKFSYGTGLYGLNEYDQADLQTIVSVTSVTTAAAYERVVSGEASTNNVYITVDHQDVDGNHKYFINGVQQLDLQLIEGSTYTFSYHNSTHPFSLSTTSDGIHNSGSEYTTGVTRDTSASTLTFVCPDDAPQLYYYCSVHAGMGGAANTSPQSAITASAEKIYQGQAIASCTTTTAANAVYTINVEASVDISSDTSSASIRIRSGGAVISTTSGTLSIGREKWEVIAPTSTTWTEIAA